MDFRGTDPRVMAGDTTGLRPFIDTNVFVFTYGREADGERIIDAQFATCSLYGGTHDGAGSGRCSASTSPTAASRAIRRTPPAAAA
jgi:hypothetical protein